MQLIFSDFVRFPSLLVTNLLQMQEVRAAGHLAQQLPQTGAVLHDLLGKELFFRVGFWVLPSRQGSKITEIVM